jgi:hypothetical protein
MKLSKADTAPVVADGVNDSKIGRDGKAEVRSWVFKGAQ